MNTTRCNPIRLYSHPNYRTRPLRLQCRNFGLGCDVVRSTSSLYEQIIPLRKELKEETKRRRIESKTVPAHSKGDVKLANWELTVGIEIHAELNTSCKLFSDAFTSTKGEPNSSIALFDLAYPGSQPHFQTATLIPALRAALALNCTIERKSSFDRKHYFYQDQPAGYQITQYYEPFARDGHIILYDHDGIAPEDGKSVTVGIKQIQMEQDTAKTLHEPPSSHMLDFNRVSHPLIEIITLPHIHHPSTAAACVKKIQSILKSVNACVAGMEVGGLRADVNVSVRRRTEAGIEAGSHSYHGVSGLGQRTEIKNLSSFKAVEDAIIAERNRQIRVLEYGGVVEGETRGWTLGSTETRKLRGKEGEVDYRYMPDPDLGPVIISSKLVDRLRQSLPALADDTLAALTDSSKYALTVKDAKTLLALDNTERLDYYLDVVENLRSLSPDLPKDIGRIAGNWVLHELGGLFSKADAPWSAGRVPSTSLARIIWYLVTAKISGRSAKQLLELVFNDDPRDVDTIVQEQNMILQQISDDEYFNLARRLAAEHPNMVQAIKQKGQKGKVMWFVGQMIRELGQGAQAEQATRVIHQVLDIPDDGKRK